MFKLFTQLLEEETEDYFCLHDLLETDSLPLGLPQLQHPRPAAAGRVTGSYVNLCLGYKQSDRFLTQPQRVNLWL